MPDRRGHLASRRSDLQVALVGLLLAILVGLAGLWTMERIEAAQRAPLRDATDRLSYAVARAVADTAVPSQPYSPERLAALRAEGRPVFVNFTAAWCITCLVNEEIAFSDPAVAEAFAASDVAYLKADWTNRDPTITAALAEQGRSGVPLYLVYPAAGGAPEILPQILTAQTVLDAVRTAGREPGAQEARLVE